MMVKVLPASRADHTYTRVGNASVQTGRMSGSLRLLRSAPACSDMGLEKQLCNSAFYAPGGE